jgi:hypothetical protein
MADNTNYVQGQDYTIKGNLTESATSITLNSFDLPSGVAIVMLYFGAIGYGVLNPGTDLEENISFTGITQNADNAILTGVIRGLDFVTPYTSSDGRKKAHGNGSVFRISNTAPFYNRLAAKDNDETITGTYTFTNTALPRLDAYAAPTDDEEFGSKKYIDDTFAGGTVSVNRQVVSGTAGEVVAAGDIVYFDETDNEWKLADASASATCDNVRLGIAQGAGVDGGAIASGVLLSGRDTNQAGLTQGDRVYVSDTAGDLASIPGTVEVEIGHAINATSIDFNPKFASFTTKDQRDALVGTSGTPASGNKYVTNDDTSVTSSASKIVRGDGSGKIDTSWLASAAPDFGGDGSDGALTVAAGTTNLDASNANLLAKNYSSINISVGATLGLTNKASNGTVLYLKCSGNAVIAGTIDMSSQGADGATNGYSIMDDLTTHDGSNGGGATNGNGAAGGSTDGDQYTNRFIYVTQDADNIYRKYYVVACGSGGGTGGQGHETGFGSRGTGGAGGIGGGAIIIEVAGDINFTGTISVDGGAGSNGTDGTIQLGTDGAGGGGGGGGGAAGMILVLYSTATSTAGTLNARGGAGGDGGDGAGDPGASAGGGGGAQGSGSYTADGNNGASGGNQGNSGSNGTNSSDASGAGGGGGGGCGTTNGGTGGTQGATDTNHTLVAQVV